MAQFDPSQPNNEFWWADPQFERELRSDPEAALRRRGTNVPSGLPAKIVLDVARIVSLIWQDGRVISKRQFFIDPDDEGLLFGRGLWESTRTFGGDPWLWDAHLDRLKRTAPLVDVAIDPEKLPDRRAVTDFVRSLTMMDVVIRLNVTAGGMGKPGTVWMSAAFLEKPIESARLQSCPSPVPKNQPYLVWKTFHYATRLRVGRSASPGYHSTLLVDGDGAILEAAHANIFIRLPDGWATPEVDGGLLPGTVREHLLKHSPLPIQEHKIPLASLATAQEAFLTNSNAGIIPIARIDAQDFPIGEETRRLMGWIRTPGIV